MVNGPAKNQPAKTDCSVNIFTFNTFHLKKAKELVHNILVKPIVYPASLCSKLIITVILGGFLFVFIVYYTPFNFNGIGEAKYLQSLIYSSISAAVLLLTMLIYPLFDQDVTKTGNFNNLKYLILMITSSVVIYIANAIYNLFNPYHDILNIGANYLILLVDVVYTPLILVANLIDWEVRRIVIVDLSPVTGKRLNVNDLPEDHQQLNIVNEQNKVICELDANRLICAFSGQNYVEVFMLDDGTVEQKLLRVTFNRFFDQIAHIPEIVRCHRTRIINLRYLKSMVTNNGRQMVRLKYIDETIPVSRNYPIGEHLQEH